MVSTLGIVRALSGPFFRFRAYVGFGRLPAPRVYYKSGDCSIWSPQQRTLNSLRIVWASVLQYVGDAISICFSTTSAGSADESGTSTVRKSPLACSTSLLHSGSSVNHLQVVVR